MPPVDRRNPIRATSSESTCNLLDFVREFPDDEACLTFIWRERFSPDGEHAYCERCDQDKHAARVYVQGDTHTQTIDGFFGLVKNAIRGVHHGVSHKWLQGYLNEYAFRYNRRKEPHLILQDMLAAAARDVN